LKIKGRAWIFGDNINTDEIIPARYLNTSDPEELAKHCMEDADPDFVTKISPGDIIVAGTNFGCGSSREHAPLAIKSCGISCVIARSFARIFYRNSINIGLPIVEYVGTSFDVLQGDEIEVDFDSGEIVQVRTGATYHAKPFPHFMQDIIGKGGLMNKIKSEM